MGRKERLTKKDIGKIYWGGLAFWLAAWLLIVVFFRDMINVNPEHPVYSWFFLIPFGVCVFYLISNAWIWRKPRSYESYKTEVDIILFVERNASILALAISMLILFTGAGVVGIEAPPAFIWYLFLALTFTICGVLPLYWIPSKEVEDLVRLRHIKTVPLFYAISFFLAGFLSVAIASI